MDDNASIRRVVSAADEVLERLCDLGSSSDIKSLLRSFQKFSEALLLLNSLTVDRANSLQDPRQTKQLLDSLEILRKCMSMLHTAMCTTIKHPTSEQAQAAKRYILDKVQSTVSDIVVTLKSECHSGSLGPCGYYTERRNSLLQLLACFSSDTRQASSFDSMVRDLVFHCMVVANSSRRDFQQRVVGHCRYILQFWSDIKGNLKSKEDPVESEHSFEKACTLLIQQIQMVDKVLMTAVVYQVLDAFLTASSTSDELLGVTRQILFADSSTKMDLIFIQPLVEDFICSADRIIQVTNFISAIAHDAKSLEGVENSKACLTRVRDQIPPLSLELADNSVQTVQKLHEACQKWNEETIQLQDAFSDVIAVREFTSITINEMICDRHGCDAAYKEQSYKLFLKHGANLICHMKLVVHSVRRYLDRSDDPIYRNGLLVLLKQVQSFQTKVGDSVRDMLSGSSLNVDVYSTFSDNVSTAFRHFKVLREGLDGQQHPHLLSPLREEARQPEISRSCDKEPCEPNWDYMIKCSDSPVLEVKETDSHTEHEEEHSDEEIIEAEQTRKYDSSDSQIPAVSTVPKPIHRPLEFDLLPLLYEVMTVTKGKDVTALNQACTGVLELSNCYAQATKEALAIVDAVDCQTLESFRAELVSLTPLVVQTAQETAMNPAKSSESIYKHSTQFTDLIGNIQKVLLPVAGTWYHAVYNELQVSLPTRAVYVTQQLNEVMTLCADVVQLLTSSDLTLQSDSQETFSVLHNKLSKAQNNTRYLVEFTSLAGQADQLQGLCILWGLSVQVLLNSLDKMLGTSTAINRLSPQKQLLALNENSLRIQEAARLTSLHCKSAYKSKQLTGYREELKAMTESYLNTADEFDIMPNVIQLAISEILQRHLLIKIRVLSYHLSKSNKDYDSALQDIVSVAYFAAEHFRENNPEDSERKFENAAKAFFESVKSATKRVEDCLNYIRDPRARSNLRSINDHLSFQISDIISRARLIVETHYICDTLSLDVQIQCWSAKACYVVEEIRKQDGISQEAKEHIRAGLQGRTPEDIEEVLDTIPFKVKDVELPSEITTISWQKCDADIVDAAASPVHIATQWTKYGPDNMEKCVSTKREYFIDECLLCCNNHDFLFRIV